MIATTINSSIRVKPFSDFLKMFQHLSISFQMSINLPFFQQQRYRTTLI